MDTTVNLKPTGTIMLQLQQSPSEYYEGHTISTATCSHVHGQRPSAMRHNRQIDQITTQSSNSSTYKHNTILLYW